MPFFLDEPRKNMLLQKGYHGSVVIYSINDVLNRSQQNGPKHPTTTVPKKEIFLILPFYGYKAKELPSNKTLALINLMHSLILLGLFSKASIVLFISGIRSVVGIS